MPPSGDPAGPPQGPLFSGRRAAGRRARAAKVGAPYLLPAALAAAAALALWAGWDRLSRVDLPIAAASVETLVREALRHQDRALLNDVYGFKSGGTAELLPVRFSDVTVAPAPDGTLARVVAVGEAEGRVTWRDEHAALSYVGREAFSMTPCSIALWCGDGRQFEALHGVLTALFRREDAFNGRDAEAYARLVGDGYAGPGGRAALLRRVADDLARGPAARVRIQAWQIRVERDRAEVGEDYEIAVEGRPPARLRARYTLGRDGERWRFVDGL